ncbi:hypothetical protein SCHPADRAFT_935826 [Schizopora paradoxa]|uniref:Uncharacterized protein n=1 Tax=Schizopora paradoxa TaxID=27342 RepID=A0A0H2SNV3_9AGAM|nr:hypothetical protein SCHPADRAFT_935826 [Schizopora paradoxa]
MSNDLQYYTPSDNLNEHIALAHSQIFTEPSLGPYGYLPPPFDITSLLEDSCDGVQSVQRRGHASSRRRKRDRTVRSKAPDPIWKTTGPEDYMQVPDVSFPFSQTLPCLSTNDNTERTEVETQGSFPVDMGIELFGLKISVHMTFSVSETSANRSSGTLSSGFRRSIAIFLNSIADVLLPAGDHTAA